MHWDRIIIIIEDFDRLLKDEIIEVLKLIDGNASFSNIIFITAFDKDKTTSILSSADNTFTDKFFDIEFPLPLRPYSAIYKLLETGLLNLISNDIDKESIKGLLINKYNIFKKYLPTIRDVKRFVNMVSLAYLPIDGEVDFVEYILISLVKYRNNDEFRQIASVNIANQGILGITDRESKIPEKFKVFSSYDILSEIFDRETPIGFRSIRRPESYDIYFQDFVYGHLRLKEIEPILNPDTNLYKTIDAFNWEFCSNDIINYLQSRDIFNFDTPVQFERFIKAILYLHSTQKETYYTTQVIKGLLQPKSRTRACATYDYTDEKYAQMFSEFLTSFYNELPVTITKELIIASIDNPDCLIISHNELLNIAIKNFTAFSNKVPTTSILHYNLMLCCITEIEPNSRKIHIDKTILDQTFALIRQSPGGYFAHFIRLQYVSSDETSNAITCDPFWPDIFKTHDAIEGIIGNATEESIPNLVLIRNFWKLYKSNDFKPIVFDHDGIVKSKIDNSLTDEMSRYNIYLQIKKEFQGQKCEFDKGEITNTLFHNYCRNWLNQLEKLNLHILTITNLMKRLKEELK